MPRSFLFVPGDSEKKLAKAAGLGADALILDLEDSVAAAARPRAREALARFLAGRPAERRSQLWVRINPLDDPASVEDLEAVLGGRPDGIVQPKTRSPDDVRALGRRLDALEAEHGIEAGAVKILPIATETPRAVFTLGDFATGVPRLAGLTWGAEDLSAAIGAASHTGRDGRWTPPYQLARSLLLFAAHAAGVAAIETLHANYRDADGLRAAAARARRDGFTGMLAIHPSQVDVINAAFEPAAAELEWARRVVQVFADNPGAATVGLDGEMLDIPHLKRAQGILQRAGSGSKN